MKLIVSNTGPILHLTEANLLNLLQNVDKICIPKMVETEMEELHPLWTKHKPEWISIEYLSADESKEAEFLYLAGLLDPDEAEAIVLSKRLKPDWFLTDDVEARIFANSLGIEVHGSLGVVLWSAAVGNLNYAESKEALNRLSKTSLWLSKDIIAQAQKALEIMFENEKSL